jgi:hypothetical protein
VFSGPTAERRARDYFEALKGGSIKNAEGYKRRRKTDRYDDFCMLPGHTDEEILFFGGKDYLPLFCSLTDAIRGTKIVFYNSATTPAPAVIRIDTS